MAFVNAEPGGDVDDTDVPCKKCGDKGFRAQMLLCDCCAAGRHTFTLDPDLGGSTPLGCGSTQEWAHSKHAQYGSGYVIGRIQQLCRSLAMQLHSAFERGTNGAKQPHVAQNASAVAGASSAMQAAWAMATGERVLFSEQACCPCMPPLAVAGTHCLH